MAVIVHWALMLQELMQKYQRKTIWMKFVDGKQCAFIVQKLIMGMIAKEAKKDTGKAQRRLFSKGSV